MPCVTNLKAAKDFGIALAIISFLSCFTGDLVDIVNGILSGLMNCLLIFGAYKRQSTAILIWMVLACISCIWYAGMAVILVTTAAATGEESVIVYIYIAILTGLIFSMIWTIIVAKNARKEIEAGQ